MANIIKGGQLIEQAPPQSPKGAAAIGAGPDAAKMMGTTAQKNNAIRQAVEAPPQPSVQPTAPVAKTASQQQASTTATRLQNITGINQRVDQLVADQIQQKAASTSATLNVDLSGRGLPADQEAAINAYIQGVNTNSPDLAQLEDSMNTTLQAAGVVDPTSYLKGMGVDLAGQIGNAGIVADPTLAQLGGTGGIAASLGYDGGDDQLAADLGVSPAELATLTLSQMQTKIKDIEEAEFSNIERLRAEMASASPARAQQIREELIALGASGQSAVDVSVGAMNKVLESADEVEFNGQNMKIADLLDDDAVSNAIIDAVGDPEALAALKELEPSLGAWVEQNKAKLDGLVGSIKANTEEAKTRQSDYATLTSDISPEIAALVSGLSKQDTSFVSAEELATANAAVASSGLVGAIKRDPALNALITSLAKDPNSADTLATLKGMSADAIIEANKLATELKAGGPLSQIYGTEEGNFLLDPDKMAKVKHGMEIMSTFKDLPGSSTITESPEFISMMKDGTFDAEEAAHIAEFGMGEWDELKQWRKDSTALKYVDEPQEVAALFGAKDEKGIKDFVASLKTAALWGDKGAKSKLAMLSGILGNNDGSIKDIAGITARLNAKGSFGKDPLSIMKGNLNSFGSTMKDIGNSIRGHAVDRGAEDARTAFLNYFSPAGKKKINSALADGVVTKDEWKSVYNDIPEDKRRSVLDVLVGRKFATESIDLAEAGPARSAPPQKLGGANAWKTGNIKTDAEWEAEKAQKAKDSANVRRGDVTELRDGRGIRKSYTIHNGTDEYGNLVLTKIPSDEFNSKDYEEQPDGTWKPRSAP